MLLALTTTSAAGQPCPPHRRCHPDQPPPPKVEGPARVRIENEERPGAAARVQQQAPAEFRNAQEQVRQERHQRWLARGQEIAQRRDNPGPLLLPLVVLAPSFRVPAYDDEGSFPIGFGVGVRWDGIELELGRLGFEVDGQYGTVDQDGEPFAFAASDLSVLWVLGDDRALLAVRLGGGYGRYLDAPTGVPDAYWGLFVGALVESYFVSLGHGQGLGFGFELRTGFRDGSAGSSARANLRGGFELLAGPRLAF